MDEQTRRTIATYDHIAADYLATHGGDRDLPERDRLAAALAPGSRLLDVGCGPGVDSAYFRRAGLRVVGVDLSWGMLQAARAVPGVALAQADMGRLPFADADGAGAFDAVWAMASLLHVPRAQAGVVVGEFGRILPPNGWLYVSVKEGHGSGWQPVSYGHAAPRYYTYWQADALTDLLTAGRFAVVEAWRKAGSSGTVWLAVLARRL